MRWACQRCTFQNDSSAAECEVCKLPRSTTTEPAEWWQCQHCCQFNSAGLRACAVCDRLADAGGVPVATNKGGAGSAPSKGSTGMVEGGAGARPIPQQRARAADNSDDTGEPGGMEGGASGARPIPQQRTRPAENAQDTGEPETVWLCQEQHNSSVCNASNSLEVYRCCQCNAVKPYLPDNLFLSQVSRDSGHQTSGGRGERESSASQEEEAELHPASTVPLSSMPTPEPCSLPRREEPPRSQSVEGVEAASASLRCLGLDNSPPDELQDEGVVEFPDSECRLVLVGKTGTGKSSSANTILGLEKRFEASFQFGSITKKCQRHNARRFGIRIEVVDTPGLFDTDMDQEMVITEVIKCLGIVAPGPHAVLLVLRLDGRFTEEENKAVDEVHKMFGVQLLRFLVIVFTHGDDLKDFSEAEKEVELKGMLDKAPENLKKLLSSANHRYVVLDNKASASNKQQQVKQLLTTVGKLLKVNGGRPFSSDLLCVVERCMSTREQELEKEHGDSRKRKRGSAKTEDERFFYRDMAREEVVQGKSLLDRIRKHVLPILIPFLSTVGRILLSILLSQAGAGVAAGNKGCALQ